MVPSCPVKDYVHQKKQKCSQFVHEIRAFFHLNKMRIICCIGFAALYRYVYQSQRYSRTGPKDHLSITATCPQRPRKGIPDDLISPLFHSHFPQRPPVCNDPFWSVPWVVLTERFHCNSSTYSHSVQNAAAGL